ncbi:regulator of Vps4 activity in the MVB pathway-domain-containing protein [Lanmaoa asiatica]|nr:regulator of Vps4 activity in the MVB pathway-domain-containing protein [Lanmaoa asiatica]
MRYHTQTLLRTTSHRLGQLQERKDSQGQLTRRDIATYLSQGHLSLARAKAATLIQEDMMGDLLEELEMLVGVVGSHVGELGLGGGIGLGLGEELNGEKEGEGEKGREREREGGKGRRMGKPPRLSPVLVEAAASIIHAAPSAESKDLNAVRDILIQRLGPAFAQTTSASRNNHVSLRITQILSSPPPTASKMDEYLVEIAQTCGIKWVPEPRRGDLLNVISEILRVDAGSSPIVDLPRLREICARGLPDDPPWVRPRIWRLLFGTLPILKTTWAKESQKQRNSYYVRLAPPLLKNFWAILADSTRQDLVRRLLGPLASLPSPTDPLSPTNALLTRISDSLFRVSPDLFVLLGNEPKSTHSGQCPLDPTAPDTIYIPCASNLDKRLALLKGNSDTCETPEIRLESDRNGGSDPTSPPSSPSSAATTLASRRQRHPTTLLPSKAYDAPPVHRAHLSALLRLLYLHSTLNPAVQSPYVPWLLVPLYSALVGETDEDDVAHAEADTFWVFEALVGEIAEMEEEEGGKIWTRKLSERIKWADGELATRFSVHRSGFLAHAHIFISRWLAPLLTQTLPLSFVFPIWDVLFACPMRTRDVNPKLEYLVDICTALLLRARTPLFRLGKPGRNAPGLWTQEHTALPPPSPLRPWELSDAFTEGIALLTSYPIDAAGGIDRILQTASDLAQKRIESRDKERERERENVGFGARIKQQMWKGFTNQVANRSPEEEEEEVEEKEDDERGEHDDGNETETPAAPTLTSRLANTASLWNYAGKLKDSDTVAAFSKVSTNWRAKALDAWRVRKGSNAPAPPGPVVAGRSRPPSTLSEIAPQQSGWPGLSGTDAPSHRRGSLPGTQRENENVILDPPRPTFFRSPRESFLPQPRRQHPTAPPSPNVDPIPPPPRDSDTESNASSLIQRAGASLSSLATFQSFQPTLKSVPRPLMLSSRDLITTKSSQPQPHSPARSEGGTPEYRGGAGQWGDVLLATKNRHALGQESISSMSSLSPSEAMNRSPHPFSSAYTRSTGIGPRSDYESDGSAAGESKGPVESEIGITDGAWRRDRPIYFGMPEGMGMGTAEERGWRHIEGRVHSSGLRMASTTTGFDSPTTIASPPIPRTPLMPAIPGPGVVRIVNGGSTVGGGGHIGTSSISTLSEASEANIPSLEPPTQNRHLVRKKTPPLSVRATTENNREIGGETLDSASGDSELSLERTPSGKAPVRLRSKRYVPRAGNPRLRLHVGTGTGMSEQRTPSPGQRTLAPEWPGEYEPATTPKMESYSGGIGEVMVGKEEGPGAVLSRAPVMRKPSKEARLRKVSMGSKETRRTRDSGAEEGDDEGYDDLLSAYESEEGSRE